MEKFSLDGIIATVILDTRRAKQHDLKKPRKKEINEPLDTQRIKKDDLFPVKFRINFMRKQFYYPSGINLELDQWNNLNITRKRELVEIKELIQSGFDKIKTHIKDMVKSDGFSIEGLNKRLSRGMKDSIFAAFDRKIEELSETGQVGTASTYECSLKSIKKFTSKPLKFSDITIEWLRKYEGYLTTERTEITADGKKKIIEAKSITTVKFYLEALRSLMNDAKGENIINEAQYPFGKTKYVIKKGEGRKMALTLSQIKDVLNYQLLTDTEKRCRDLWFFSYLCNGMNMKDLIRLKYKDISGGEIHFYRQKTIRTTHNQKEIAATLLPQMVEIMQKWGTKDKKPENYIFPFLSHRMTPMDEKRITKNVTRLINKKMKTISDGLNLENISTYTARHSFATVLKRSGANIAFISESLGHSDLQTTEHYLSSFESAERAKNAAKLTQF